MILVCVGAFHDWESDRLLGLGVTFLVCVSGMGGRMGVVLLARGHLPPFVDLNDGTFLGPSLNPCCWERPTRHPQVISRGCSFLSRHYKDSQHTASSTNKAGNSPAASNTLSLASCVARTKPEAEHDTIIIIVGAHEPRRRFHITINTSRYLSITFTKHLLPQVSSTDRAKPFHPSISAFPLFDKPGHHSTPLFGTRRERRG